MAEPSYIADDRICFGDLEVMLLTGAESEPLAKRDDVYYMVKSRPYLDGYNAVRNALGGSARNILEVGVYRGGSAPFLHRYFDAQRVVCVDIVQDVIPLNRYAQETSPVLRLNYGIDQSDKASLRRIMRSDFDGQIDLVVDDASHHYAPSKATFEAVFPFLRPGGVYILEDWAWSHGDHAQKPDHFWWNQESPTTLVFEFIAAHGHPSGLISSVGFGPGLMWVTKGHTRLPEDGFSLDDFLNLRGRKLSTL